MTKRNNRRGPPPCPACGSRQAYHRATKEKPYRCRRCGETYTKEEAKRAQDVQDATSDYLSKGE